jgi:hypothetical protein
MMNDSLTRFPLQTVGTFVVLDAATVASLAGAYSLAGIVVPPDFALAFALSRLFRRLRLPLDIGVAAVLARVYPPLTRVTPTAMFSTGQSGVAAPPATTLTARAVAALSSAIDKYGLALMLAQRSVVSLGSVAVIFAALRSGVDVSAALSALEGMAGETIAKAIGGAGAIAGSWAAGVVTAGPLFPLTLLASGYLGGALGRWKSKLKNK